MTLTFEHDLHTQHTDLEQHELVERFVPLHQEDTRGRDATQVLVAVVRIPAHAAARAAAGLRHLRAADVLPVVGDNTSL